VLLRAFSLVLQENSYASWLTLLRSSRTRILRRTDQTVNPRGGRGGAKTMVMSKLHSPQPSRRPSRGIRIPFAIGLRFCLALLPFSGTKLVPQSKPSEYEVEAAYLFNFGKFVRLSPNAQATAATTYDICVVGEDRMGKSLDAITANEQIDARSVRVLRLKDAAEAQSCAIAFFSASEDPRIEKELGDLKHADVLTVGDSARFLAMGGMIQFVTVAKHVRFAINLEAVKRTHLVLSSELLRVATSVSGKPSPEGEP
jgi:hypothetical protein